MSEIPKAETFQGADPVSKAEAAAPVATPAGRAGRS